MSRSKFAADDDDIGDAERNKEPALRTWPGFAGL